jgi:hypothetical protein
MDPRAVFDQSKDKIDLPIMLEAHDIPSMASATPTSRQTGRPLIKKPPKGLAEKAR